MTEAARRLVANLFSGGSQFPGELKELAEAVGALRLGFPDLVATTERLVVEDGQVAAQLLLRGTQTGPYLGVAPTGRGVAVPATFFADVLEGQVGWVRFGADRLALLQQVGSLNLPSSAPNGPQGP